MSLRNQPYLPLYVEDFLTDEKLVFCSAATTGVYIRLMCIMHKSEEYGKILLKQKFKQSPSNLKNFASQLAVQMPYDYQTILFALEELVCTKVLQEEPCAISQRRMVKDNAISEKRTLSGKKGGEKSLGKNRKKPPDDPEKEEDFACDFAQANLQAKSENEIVYENTDENKSIEGVGEKKEGVGEKKEGAGEKKRGAGEKSPEWTAEESEGARSCAHSAQEPAEAEVVDELSFGSVWALYERKGNKKLSQRRWGALAKKAKLLALEHIQRYVEATPDLQYRKNFETYLNQEAWNDRIITKNGADSSNSQPGSGGIDENLLRHVAAGIARARNNQENG
jgi:hypothetical protein